MKNISLLPPELVAEREFKRKRNRFLFAGSVFIAILLTVYAALGLLTFYNRYEAGSVAQERQFLQRESARFHYYQQKQEQVRIMEKIVQQAMGTPPEWNRILAQLNAGIPADIWLSDLRMNYDHEADPVIEQGEFILRGRAFNHQAVGRCLREIHNIGELEHVHCSYAQLRVFSGREMVEFEIKADILPGAGYHAGDGGRDRP